MSKAALAVSAAVAGGVTKPVAQPDRKKPQRTGPTPVTKGAAPKRERVSKDQRQRVKLLLARPSERRLLDRLLTLAVDGKDLFGLSAEEVAAAHQLLKRSQERRWES